MKANAISKNESTWERGRGKEERLKEKVGTRMKTREGEKRNLRENWEYGFLPGGSTP